MPESDQSVAAELESAVRDLPSLGSLFANGETPAHVIHTLLASFEPEVIGSRSIEFLCTCSSERFGDYLRSLPEGELDDILEHGPFPVKVTCHNCNSTYMYSKEEIERFRTR